MSTSKRRVASPAVAALSSSKMRYETEAPWKAPERLDMANDLFAG